MGHETFTYIYPYNIHEKNIYDNIHEKNIYDNIHEKKHLR
jgi:hypothetical protein